MISSKQASDDIDNPSDGGNIKCKTRREQTYIYVWGEKEKKRRRRGGRPRKNPTGPGCDGRRGNRYTTPAWSIVAHHALSPCFGLQIHTNIRTCIHICIHTHAYERKYIYTYDILFFFFFDLFIDEETMRLFLHIPYDIWVNTASYTIYHKSCECAHNII